MNLFGGPWVMVDMMGYLFPVCPQPDELRAEAVVASLFYNAIVNDDVLKFEVECCPKRKVKS